MTHECPALRPRHRDHRAGHARIRADPDAAMRSPSPRGCSARSAAAAPNCSRAALRGRCEFDAGELPDFLAETRAVREGELDLRSGAGRHPRPARRDHRARRPQDDHQRAQLGRQRVHGGLRGCEHAALGQQHPGPAQPARRDPPPHRLRVAGRQGVSAERTDGDAVRAAARLAPAGEARDRRRRADLRRHLRLRAVLLPQREGARARAAAGRTSTCRSSKAISRRGCGTTSSSWRRTTSAFRAGRSRRRC